MSLGKQERKGRQLAEKYNRLQLAELERAGTIDGMTYAFAITAILERERKERDPDYSFPGYTGRNHN